MFPLSILYKEQRGNGLSRCQEACSTKFEAANGLSSCEQESPSYYSLQLHRRKEIGAKHWKTSDTVVDLNKIWRKKGKMVKN